jgi:hypothetical protein
MVRGGRVLGILEPGFAARDQGGEHGLVAVVRDEGLFAQVDIEPLLAVLAEPGQALHGIEA